MNAAERTALTLWHVSGTYRYQQDESTASGRFSWDHHPESYEFRLMHPLGWTELLLERKDNQLFLSTPQHKKQNLGLYEGDMWLTSSGLDIPLRALSYWIRGVPDPHHPVRPGSTWKPIVAHAIGATASLNQAPPPQARAKHVTVVHRPVRPESKHFYQQGWHVTLSHFNADGLPQEVLLSRKGVRLWLNHARWHAHRG